MTGTLPTSCIVIPWTATGPKLKRLLRDERVCRSEWQDQGCFDRDPLLLANGHWLPAPRVNKIYHSHPVSLMITPYSSISLSTTVFSLFHHYLYISSMIAHQYSYLLDPKCLLQNIIENTWLWSLQSKLCPGYPSEY